MLKFCAERSNLSPMILFNDIFNDSKQITYTKLSATYCKSILVNISEKEIIRQVPPTDETWALIFFLKTTRKLHRQLQKRERTGKEYGCFPFV